MDDIFIHGELNPRPKRRGMGPGLVFLFVVAMLALVSAIGFQRLRRTDGEPGDAVGRAATPDPSAAQPARAPADPASVETPAADDPALPLFKEARSLHSEGALTPARKKAMEALDMAATPALRREVENLLGELHSVLAFTPAPMEEKIDYTIRPGDTLAAIARRHGVTLELLTKSNGIKGDIIRPGARLRILQGSFSVAVDKSANELTVYLNARFFKRYRVGTGRHEKTPTGEFKIDDRIAQPTWFRPDGKVVPYGHKENELGTHWLSLDLPGYGIHGTWEPDTIGRQAGAGCIRLLNADVEELFALLPVGTPVSIRD